MRQRCDSFCVHNLQETTFVCTTAIESTLRTTPTVNFCMPYCNCQHFWEKQHLYGLLQPLQSTSHYYSFWLLNAQWQLTMFYALLQLTSVVAGRLTLWPIGLLLQLKNIKIKSTSCLNATRNMVSKFKITLTCGGHVQTICFNNNWHLKDLIMT